MVPFTAIEPSAWVLNETPPVPVETVVPGVCAMVPPTPVVAENEPPFVATLAPIVIGLPFAPWSNTESGFVPALIGEVSETAPPGFWALSENDVAPAVAVSVKLAPKLTLSPSPEKLPACTEVPAGSVKSEVEKSVRDCPAGTARLVAGVIAIAP
jgi:hypothetical protein